MPTTSPTTLYRLSAIAGFLCALILLINAGRRGGVIANSDLTHVIAPLGEIFGLVAISGLYFIQRGQGGRLGLVGYGIHFVGLAGLVGAEFILNLIFPALPAAQVTALLGGPAGAALKASSLLFLIGAMLFAAALWRVAVLPRPAVLLYALGCVPIGLRGVLPAVTLPIGLAGFSAALVWLSVELLREK
ncbi:hypothetical protein ACWCXH_38445 [Kitasatospora sp. NPDC001660]